MNQRLVWVSILLLGTILASNSVLAYTLYASEFTVKKGSISNQAISVLNSHEQSGLQDSWATYIEAKPDNKKFVGVLHFNQPFNAQWQEIRINVNTLGEAASRQRWIFQIRNVRSMRWQTVGDNSSASGWVWNKQLLLVSDNIDNYIDTSGTIRLRYLSNNAVDVSNIDLATIELVEADNAGLPSEDEWWKPTPTQNLTWQWQINGTIDTSLNVDVYDIDLFDTSAAQIAAIQAKDKIVVCYFSAGTYEGWRDDWRTFFPFIDSDSFTGNNPPFAGNMADWDERWLDIRRIDLLEGIMRSRMELAQEKGCDAVEPDNMDAYINGDETGINLSAQDQLNYNKFIANLAHEYGLSVGLKNDVDQLDELVDYFDWALNEQCFQYNECDGYSVFIDAGKAVFGVEYSGNAETFCVAANEQKLYWLKKNLALDSWRIGCEHFK